MLKDHPHPLTVRSLCRYLRHQRVGIRNHEVMACLRKLVAEEEVHCCNGRWSIHGGDDSIASPAGQTPGRPWLLPPVSLSARRLLSITDNRYQSGDGIDLDSEDKEIISDDLAGDPATNVFNGPWGLFRRLVNYYRHCLRNEKGAEASAYQNQLTEKFTYLSRVGPWFPRPGRQWRDNLAMGSHLAPLLKNLPAVGSDDQSLVIGYPVRGVYVKKEDEPDVAIIMPVFLIPLDFNLSESGLMIRSEDPRWETNLGWLEKAFSRKRDQQRNFLSACGYINHHQLSDESPGLERGESGPGLESLVTALNSFMVDDIRERLDPRSIPASPLLEPFPTGIYNRAVIMLARKTPFNQGLLKELAAIQNMPDEELDRTGLRWIFRDDYQDNIQDKPEPKPHEAFVVDTNLLNAEQRQAVASLLKNEITVVTGPPGTGKSQVVSGAIANTRLQKLTVLFSSRNHKAIDAVYKRATDPADRPLLTKTNSKEDPSFRFDFSKAIRQMLQETHDPNVARNLDRVKVDLESRLKERGVQAEQANRLIQLGQELGQLEERAAYLVQEMPDGLEELLTANPEGCPVHNLKKILKVMESLRPSGNHSIQLSAWIRCLGLWSGHSRTRKWLKAIPHLINLPRFPTPKVMLVLSSRAAQIDRVIEFISIRRACHPLEKQIGSLPSMEELTQTIANQSERLAELAPQALSLELDQARGLPPGVEREELDGLATALRSASVDLEHESAQREARQILRNQCPRILTNFPAWTVTNLSVGSRLPLLAGMFDLAIIDEASQSDIASAIPILFRARRVGVIGDPYQLNHISNLPPTKDAMLRRRNKLSRLKDLRFNYSEKSFFDLAAGSNQSRPIFLSQTYRSTEDVAGYSNDLFYDGRLRVATNHQRLKVPPGMTPGIHWTEVDGDIESGGPSGCHCPQEVDLAVGLIRTMLVENNFKGSIGVVTPFRQQANRLQDNLLGGENDLYNAFTLADGHVDTAHGFQGDERDVIIFSLCCGPSMPRGSKAFVRESGNLFNVAVSRARALVHVIGNREWARKCGINHIQRLARPKGAVLRPDQQTPWYPHESPWEQKLHQALKSVGLEPRPQFPVTGRRLDLALIRTGDKPLKIDIEVDGDCHRDHDGSRQIDDHWRDIQLIGQGWKVIRFWTYQLREDMAGCVDRIQAAWSGHA